MLRRRDDDRRDARGELARDGRSGLAALAEPVVLETPVDGGALAIRDAGVDEPREPRVVGGTLVELVGAVDRAIVFGLGHVGRAVEAAARRARLHGDRRATTTRPARSRRASRRGRRASSESFDAAEVEARAAAASGRGDHVLVVTRDHAVDQRLLEALLARDELAYLGMIGSRGKVLRFKKRFAARGMLDGELGQARWARLHAPIGLDVSAETPEEIAVVDRGAAWSAVRRGRVAY